MEQIKFKTSNAGICREITDLNKFLVEKITIIHRDIQEKIKPQIYDNATPKIKGEITRGKLRWRGIKKVIDPFDEWYEQRGQRITDKIPRIKILRDTSL